MTIINNFRFGNRNIKLSKINVDFKDDIFIMVKSLRSEGNQGSVLWSTYTFTMGIS